MTTGTVLDAAEAHDPKPWWRRPGKTYTALQIASAALEECRKDQLEHAQKAEYHAALLKMLKDRDARLIKDITRLSQKRTTHLDESPSPSV